MSRSTLWDSAASTQTWAAVRSMGRGVWRTGFLLLLAFCVLAAMERGGLERYCSLDTRWALERWRLWTGPLLAVPVMVSGAFAWKRLSRSPLLPGRRVLLSLVGLAIAILGVLAPWAWHHRQQHEEALCREHHLPQALEMWQRGALLSPLPSCPSQWEDDLGTYVLTADPGSEVVIRDSKPWHSGRMLGITRDGNVVILSEDEGIPPR
ncbi:MAG: hypothetical protein AB7F75_05485 [Planctomycetota bacterium]